jgi:hypothetical protein
MLVTLVSAKGSPGVTTAAAALAAVAAELPEVQDNRDRVDLVELDPSGGDVEPLTGITGESGLLRAVADLSPVTAVKHAVDAPPGVRSLLAPTSGQEASSAIAAGVGRWGPVLWESGAVVIADAGRWEPGHWLADRIQGADVLALVCRSDARSVEHALHVVPQLRDEAERVMVVAVGERPYSIEEIAACLGLEPAGTLLWDPVGAASLWRRGFRGRRWHPLLAQSARSVLPRLTGPDRKAGRP